MACASELPPRTYSLTSEGGTAELAVGVWFVVTTIGLEPTQVDPTRLETLRLNLSATPPVLVCCPLLAHRLAIQA